MMKDLPNPQAERSAMFVVVVTSSHTWIQQRSSVFAVAGQLAYANRQQEQRC